MSDVTVAWVASPSASTTNYLVTYTVNGTAQTQVSVPRTSAQDSGGYSSDINSALPSLTLNPGDVVGASVAANDSVNNLQSAAIPSVPATVTIPTVPVAPAPPSNVVLSLS